MRKRILIADDDPTVVDVLKIVLEKAGYETEFTLDGKVLLNPPAPHVDLILLDVRMSGVDGLIVCKYLKSQAQTKAIPIVMVSAVPDLSTLAGNAGADGFLEKPFNMDQLLNVVEENIAQDI